MEGLGRGTCGTGHISCIVSYPQELCECIYLIVLSYFKIGRGMGRLNVSLNEVGKVTKQCP